MAVLKGAWGVIPVLLLTLLVGCGGEVAPVTFTTVDVVSHISTEAPEAAVEPFTFEGAEPLATITVPEGWVANAASPQPLDPESLPGDVDDDGVTGVEHVFLGSSENVLRASTMLVQISEYPTAARAEAAYESTIADNIIRGPGDVASIADLGTFTVKVGPGTSGPGTFIEVTGLVCDAVMLQRILVLSNGVTAEQVAAIAVSNAQVLRTSACG